MKPLIPCLVEMIELDGTWHQYTGQFRSVSDATQDAIRRFGYGMASAKELPTVKNNMEIPACTHQ